MDKLAAMRAFVEIVDRGSLTAAAASLDKSPPSMVRILAALEAALGARLLRRTTRQMSLTDEGRRYLERCRLILADVDEAEEAITSGRVEPHGELRLTAPVLFGQLHVAPVVRAWVRRFSGVQVELILLDRVVNLVEEGIDAAVRIGSLEDSSLIATSLGEVRRVVCASPALIESIGAPESPEELSERPCVLFRGLSPGSQWRFRRRGGRPVVVRVEGAFRCNQAAVAAEACAEGLGFGLFLSYQVDALIRAGKLCRVLEDWEPPPLPVSVVYTDSRLMPSRLRSLVDLLTQEMRERPGLAT